MTKRGLTVLASTVAFAAMLGACQETPTEPDTAEFAKPAPVIENSNGAPSGPHYNLNIIGGPKNKTADMTGNNGRRIFVPEDGKTKIMLGEGDFAVLDANGTDRDGATFQLPNPDPDCDGITEYSVYVRALGKPGGSATMQTCYEDAIGTWCAVDYEFGVDPITIGREKGKSTFRNESKNLLYVDYCVEYLEVDGVIDSTQCIDWAVSPLFGVDGASYWWDYDNSGLKIAQFRFYPIATDAWSGEEIYCSD
jgi:hypothetical protein